MNKKKFIGLQLAKFLKENNCDIKSEYFFKKWYLNGEEKITIELVASVEENYPEKYPAYSYCDIMVTHAEEFFGEELIEQGMWDMQGRQGVVANYTNCAIIIINLLQQNKQKEADQYIIDNCIFNPKNK